MRKILIISVGKLSGGVEKYTLMLKRYLENEQYELHFVVRKNAWLAKNLESNHMLRIDMGKNMLSDMIAIKRYVDFNDIDIIHCNSNNALFISLLIKESDKRKKIAVIHGDVLVDQESKGRLIQYTYKKLENWLLKKKSYRCIAVSKSLKNILENRGVPGEKIEVIYNAVEAVKYESLPDYFENKLRICTVGYLLPLKNQILLLEALNCLRTREPDIQFVCDIYGEGTEKSKLEKYIEDNNLREVRLKGFDPEVREKLNQYALYVQPSKYESFGIAVIEAMYAGCYVVVNDVGGMREIVNEDIGSIVLMESKEILADTIKEIYKNRLLMKRKAEEGQKYVADVFPIERMISSYRTLYERVLGETG